MRFSIILTSEQAALLFDLVKERRADMIARTSYGIWDGLLQALAQIDRGGGALLRAEASVLEYGCEVIEAAVITTATYIAWPGNNTVPAPFLEHVGLGPDLKVDHLTLRPVSLSRPRVPIIMVPLPPVRVFPPLPLR